MFLVSIAKKLQEQSRRLQVANPLACLSGLRMGLIEVQAMAELKGILALSGPLRRVLLLCDIAEILAPEQPQESASIIALAAEGLGRMADELLSPESSFDMNWVVRESDRLWGRYLDLLPPLAGVHAGKGAQGDVGDLDAPPAIDIACLLAMLGVNMCPAHKTSAESRSLFEVDDEEIPPAISSAQLLKMLLKQPAENKRNGANSQAWIEPVITTPPSPALQSHPAQADLPKEPQPAAPLGAKPSPILGPMEKFSGPLADPATRLAFREDSENLTERIGSLLPELERGEQTPNTLRELGRCLHTLKGAAGAVGLSQIAEFVHRLEDLNQAAIGTTGPVNSELLVGVHDLLLQLEHVIVRLTDSVPGDPDATVNHADAVADDSVSLEAPASPSSSVFLGDAIVSDVDEAIRVPIARLGELMDLVAELLVLNGPRSSLATRVKDFATTVRCSRNRLACSIDQLCELHAGKSIEEALPADQAADSADRDQAFLGVVRHLSEQADDLLILAENLRGVAVPMADDADIAARLTRHLWELLQDIRVVSIRPLLQRLARVARAASKIEGKQVRVVLEGEDALLDRLMQDKVFEPLLHIIRNAVGHGIERPADRTASGKDPEGTVWITAVQAEDTLTFTVRDDGRGLDYARIEQRARDLGLLHGDERPDVDRLTEFIFRSGFSTRAGADALSGRGVGMDIVSSEVTRLQGTVRLQSEPGQGTSVTVRLPAQISLEQAMVFSVDGQHFALPLKSVDREAAVSEGEPSASSSRGQGEPLCARSVLGYPARPPGMVPVGLPVLIEREVRELLVDKIEGPYELVARPLNPLLADHPVVSGTSLAVDGELVLLLDPSRLATYQNRLPIPSLGHVAAVLVVDDSISVRRTLVNYLTALGLEVDEAGDGVEALKFMKERAYCFVITDLHMPRKDGFQLLADLEKDSKLATTPVIVSSARFDEKTHQSVLRLGAKAVLPKPVGMEKLAEVIAPLINVAG